MKHGVTFPSASILKNFNPKATLHFWNFSHQSPLTIELMTKAKRLTPSFSLPTIHVHPHRCLRAPSREKSSTPTPLGYWQDKNVTPEQWNSHTWQLEELGSRLAGLEEHLTLSEEERAGVLLSGNKLAMAITPHYFNLIHPTDPDCPDPPAGDSPHRGDLGGAGMR